MTRYCIAAYIDEVLSGDIFGTMFGTKKEAENFLSSNRSDMPDSFGEPKIYKITVEVA